MQNQTDYTPPGEGKWTFTGYHMLACVVAFFAVIMFANFTMAWLASSSWTGLVVKNSYVASQGFNDKLEAARQQKSRGWKVRLTYPKNSINVQFKDNKNNPVSFKTVTAIFARPVSQNNDTMVILSDLGNGHYGSTVSLAAGVWLVTVIAKGKEPYRIEGRLVISKDGQGKMQ